MYFQDAEAALIVYDVTYPESFEAAKTWVKDLKENSNVEDMVLAIIGNKSDMMDKYAVQLEEAHTFASSVGAEIVKETSARDNNGVNEVFQLVAAKLLKKSKSK